MVSLFFSADIYQGDERFSVHSRGKQCAFMSLSALLTARNIPLNLWSRITFKYALLQGDKMFLNALDSGLRPRLHETGTKSIRDDLVSVIVLFIIDVYMRPG